MSARAVLPRTITVPEPTKLRADSDLILRAQDGDQEACATIFDLHRRRVYSTCLLMTKNVSDAEDLMQDAFIQIFRGLRSFRGDSAFSTWIYRVVVNTVLMTRRKKHLREVSLDEPSTLDYSPVPREFGRDDMKLTGAVDRVSVLTQAAQELPEGWSPQKSISFMKWRDMSITKLPNNCRVLSAIQNLNCTKLD